MLHPFCLHSATFHCSHCKQCVVSRGVKPPAPNHRHHHLASHHQFRPIPSLPLANRNSQNRQRAGRRDQLNGTTSAVRAYSYIITSRASGQYLCEIPPPLCQGSASRALLSGDLRPSVVRVRNIVRETEPVYGQSVIGAGQHHPTPPSSKVGMPNRRQMPSSVRLTRRRPIIPHQTLPRHLLSIHPL